MNSKGFLSFFKKTKFPNPLTLWKWLASVHMLGYKRATWHTGLPSLLEHGMEIQIFKMWGGVTQIKRESQKS